MPKIVSAHEAISKISNGAVVAVNSSSGLNCPDAILEAMTAKYKNEDITTIDGVKIDFATEWVHLRKSNTEPIIRIYTEAPTQGAADQLALRIIDEIKAVAGI